TFVTYSGHNPFRLPDELKDSDFDVDGSRLPAVVKDYITINHYVDSQLHTIVDYLRSRSDWDETLVVITGDHEGLASWRSDIRSSSPEAAELVDGRQMTPFIVLNSPVGGRFDGVMGQIDMYPTLLDLLGLDDYSWRGLGQSILSPDYHATAISTMTLEHLGDTTSMSPALLDHLRSARSVSDAIIRHNLLKTL
ncbi:MAG: sulfatase-like hydrolase/transferase, partial [Duncaniella sp.]|nr:sulfatase-like hydrolase/transferase [Duncaniella sp.]